MDWKRLYQLQAELDQHIMDSIPQTRQGVYHDKLLALVVEVSELANETRCFKYWSQKGPSDREVILEEYVDGIHFILSLGLDLGIEFDQNALQSVEVESLTDSFHTIYSQVERLKTEPTQTNYNQLMNQYLALGRALSFSTHDVVQAYLAKNEKNHERQDLGY
ncbi:dUTP diphosphatase [Alkalibacillus salilacus]|uniref:Dimeric dUTPase (All-alpha-NTP-PPase superfamily) n=1 Tax=Alkalibacillus salilacus TaxID=284582 RepID=A0ABT9VGY2_9BACI|nr:dUTP diphosphatase [Alkalibacillus salilacus]MDQ0160216.1 dimeric dUTPase (all-alpha-NTP-PPase superfamily) [Alkalibacillus salilacus]